MLSWLNCLHLLTNGKMYDSEHSIVINQHHTMPLIVVCLLVRSFCCLLWHTPNDFACLLFKKIQPKTKMILWDSLQTTIAAVYLSYCLFISLYLSVCLWKDIIFLHTDFVIGVDVYKNPPFVLCLISLPLQVSFSFN